MLGVLLFYTSSQVKGAEAGRSRGLCTGGRGGTLKQLIPDAPPPVYSGLVGGLGRGQGGGATTRSSTSAPWAAPPPRAA